MKRKNIICLASQTWNSHWCTPQQIMSRLSKNNNILYIEPLRSFFSLLKWKNNNNPDSQFKSIEIYNPPPVFFPFLLYARFNIFKKFNEKLLAFLLRKWLKKNNISDYYFWVYQVTYSGAEFLNHSDLLIYDCIDEWAGVIDNQFLSRYIKKLDNQLCQQADVLFVGSDNLYQQRNKFNKNISLIPQGVDLDVFLKASEPETKIPDELNKIPNPIVGLVGVLNKERIDIDLLVEMAQKLSISIVLIGPVWDGLDIKTLKQYESIYLLGNKPLESLGGYLKGLDVCMIPYLINDFTRNIYPLKLHEYLASGKPVVTTEIPACREFGDLMYIAHSRDEFINNVKLALNENNPELLKKRIEIARNNDWNKRALDKIQAIQSVLSEDKHK